MGEGLWTGTLMLFVRLAGCTVGKPINGSVPYEQCQLYDGRKFLCDTNYRLTKRLTVDEILAELPEGVKHVCITGGEPLMHPIVELINAAKRKGCLVHIETSGTITQEWLTGSVHNSVWVTVSPKMGWVPAMLLRANEIKLLVDNDFKLQEIPSPLPRSAVVFLSPVNGVKDLNWTNIQHCLDIQKQYPHFRLTMQLHKILGVR